MIWLFFAILTVHSLTLDPQATQPLHRRFDHGNYFAAPLPLGPYLPLKAAAEELAGQALNSRGEAHLTLVTPPELSRLTATQRQQLLSQLIALDWSHLIQPVCVGAGEARGERTYYVVVDAEPVAQVRRQFGLEVYYPHITLGFTRGDLHLQDGVIKDPASCKLPLQ